MGRARRLGALLTTRIARFHFDGVEFWGANVVIGRAQ